MSNAAATEMFTSRTRSGDAVELRYQTKDYAYSAYEDCLAVWVDGEMRGKGKVKWIGYCDAYTQQVLEEYKLQLSKKQKEEEEEEAEGSDDEDAAKKKKTTKRRKQSIKRKPRRSSIKKSPGNAVLDDNDMMMLERLTALGNGGRSKMGLKSQKNEIFSRGGSH